MDTENKAPDVAPASPMGSMKHNTLMAILAYVGILVIVPFLTSKDDAFVKFHIKQGVVLVVIEIAVWVLGSMFWTLWPLWRVVNIVTVIFSIIGIVYAAQGKEKELPFIGQFAKYVTF